MFENITTEELQSIFSRFPKLSTRKKLTKVNFNDNTFESARLRVMNVFQQHLNVKARNIVSESLEIVIHSQFRGQQYLLLNSDYLKHLSSFLEENNIQPVSVFIFNIYFNRH